MRTVLPLAASVALALSLAACNSPQDAYAPVGDTPEPVAQPAPEPEPMTEPAPTDPMTPPPPVDETQIPPPSPEEPPLDEVLDETDPARADPPPPTS